MNLLTIQEAVDSSCDRGLYPDVFPVEIGEDFKLQTRPDLFARIPNPRKVRIEISSFRGMCYNAIHYYAHIQADGIELCRKEKDGETERTVMIHGYLGKEFYNLPRHKQDLWGGDYDIAAARFVTEAEIANDPDRWEGYTAGDYTDAFNTAEEAEETARAIVSARFGEGWKVIIENPYRHSEKQQNNNPSTTQA